MMRISPDGMLRKIVLAGALLLPFSVRGDVLKVYNKTTTSGISNSMMYQKHTAGVQEGFDGTDIPWTNAPAVSGDQWLKVFTIPYAIDLYSDCRPTNSETVFLSKLSVIDKTKTSVTCTNRILFDLTSLDATRHYTASINCLTNWTPSHQPFSTNVNIRDVISGNAGYVDLPGIVNCPSGTVYGTCDVLPAFNRLVVGKSGAGNGTNTIDGVAVEGSTAALNYGTNKTVVANAAAGSFVDYYISRTNNSDGLVYIVTTNDVSSASNPVSQVSIPINNIKGSNSLHVVYGSLPTCTLSSSASAGGTNDPLGNVSVVSGGSTSVVVRADNDYKIQKILKGVGGVTNEIPEAVGKTAYTNQLNNITNDTSISSYFAVGQTAGGIPYTWLSRYGIADKSDNTETNDTDLDGYNTLDEWISDTDPTNNASYFKPITFSLSNNTGRVYIGFPESSTGRNYTVLGRANLTSGDWSDKTNGMGNGATKVLDMEQDASGTYFYKGRVGLP